MENSLSIDNNIGANVLTQLPNPNTFLLNTVFRVKNVLQLSLCWCYSNSYSGAADVVMSPFLITVAFRKQGDNRSLEPKPVAHTPQGKNFNFFTLSCKPPINRTNNQSICFNTEACKLLTVQTRYNIFSLILTILESSHGPDLTDLFDGLELAHRPPVDVITVN